MKKVFLITAVIIFLFSLTAFSHPPADIEMAFELENNILEASVTHRSQNNQDHFVEKVEIFLNDELMIKQDFLIQSNNDQQNLLYLMPGVVEGDTIKIIAYCNQFGSLEEEMLIE
ncbi:hypothetical protein [Halanaerobium hydrogeniformans]|uniref:Uncharacterized protein n=1 Tax=Halanaerobium hydrogeniformans TaxID=656519 RepID=E4RK79_HALHG|nr:hypothetical protein [Halanaerobium hydrogeniformans]ADQ14631.1 hypothetical protein Halsa_1200 [Halanaerobium hydrogeniformans]